MRVPQQQSFHDELMALLKKHAPRADTPDHVLIGFICGCLLAFDSANKAPPVTLPTVNTNDVHAS